LFSSRDFAGANLLTLLLYAALSGTLFFLTLNLIQVQEYSATAAGAAFLPFVLIMFLFRAGLGVSSITSGPAASNIWTDHRCGGSLCSVYRNRGALLVGSLSCRNGARSGNGD